MWAISHFHTYLYGNHVIIYTDHSAVKAVLQTPNPTGKHARWWTKVYGSDLKDVQIIYRAGKTNLSTDALSRSPQAPAPTGNNDEIQVAAVTSQETSIQSLLQLEPKFSPTESFTSEQRKDPCVREIIHFLEREELPPNPIRAWKVAMQGPLLMVLSSTLTPRRRRTTVVTWVAISLATDCKRLLPTTGGGKGCIQMPSTMLGTVQNVQLSQEEDNNIGPHFTQSQCNDPSKSLVLILWIYPEPSKGTNMS